MMWVDYRKENPNPLKSLIRGITGGKTVDPDITKTASLNSVDLELKLFRLDRDHAYKDELTFAQSTKSFPWTRVFGIVLNNASDSSPAHNVSIRLEFFWNGSIPTKSPSFEIPPRTEGWKAQVNNISHKQPAVLVFRDASLTSIYRHPIEWPSSKLTLQEPMKGYFVISYTVSSAQPYSSKTKELRINVDTT
jgi:hypothetical protein